MHGLPYATALVLAVVFGVAAIAKLGNRQATVDAFVGLGLPPWAATIVPVVELALAAGLVVAPGWSAVFALALLAAFTTFLVRVVRQGTVVPCRCFGSVSSQPVSTADVVRNVLLAAAAVIALGASGPTRPGAPALIATAVGTGAALLAVRRLRAR